MSGIPRNPRLSVDLSGMEIATHYTLSAFLLIPTGVMAYCLLTHQFAPDRIDTMRTICLVTLPLAVMAALLQRYALRFRRFSTSSDPGTNYRHVVAAMHKAGWRIRRQTADSRIIASVPGDITWGTRVEVLFRGNDVLANSICDPEKWPCGVGWIENSDNLKFIRQAVTDI
jgi:hypothetical protein